MSGIGGPLQKETLVDSAPESLTRPWSRPRTVTPAAADPTEDPTDCNSNACLMPRSPCLWASFHVPELKAVTLILICLLRVIEFRQDDSL